jgi:glycosyltransferase involved in cell wall biosynthesis
MKKISVILTTYNGEKTIRRTIDSILGQEGIGVEFKIELIVIDDCSNDNTFSILEKYECILIRNDNNSGGPNKGRNKGLQLATGDYICIADQDDIWKKNKIKTMLPYLDSAPIITSGYEVIDVNRNKVTKRNKSTSSEYVFFEKNQTFIKRLTKSLLGQNTYLGSIIYSHKLKDILFEEHFGMVDFDWILRLFHQQTSIEVCQALYERIVDGSNLSLNSTYRKYDFFYSLMTLEQYEELYPSEVLYGYKKINGSRARYYYLIGNMKKARFYFLRSPLNFKTVFYYITSFAGSKLVKKHFNVFG